MIVTDRFVFVHVHKTGGRTLNAAIERCIEDHRVVGYHYPRSEVPEECAGLPVVGIIRNPWDWYVSWYAFNRRPKIRNQLFFVVSDGGNEGFKATISNLIHLGSDRPESQVHRDELIKLLPDSLVGNQGTGLTKDSIREFSDNETGYLLWLFDRMLGGPDDDQVLVGRFENLQDDFLSIMEQLGVEEVLSLQQELVKQERKNTSRHSHYSHYYDNELRDLVASKERPLIEKYGYEFEQLKPSETFYEYPADSYSGGREAFRKLLGRESNFLRLNDEIDVAAIQQKLKQFPEERWLESERERLFDVHRDTQALILVHYEDHKYDQPEYRELYSEFQEVLEPAINFVAGYYQNNGFIVRLILARLQAGGKIPKHTDAGYSLLNCHRVHLPVISNDDVAFFVGGEEKNMREGELWEINNGTVHGVENRSNDDRIHLIIDWMPNHKGGSASEVLASGLVSGEAGAAANAATLDKMIERGHQMHQAGHVAKAESLYRQVVHFDVNHVVGNNLLGLLCLQTKRFEDAVTYIRAALSAMPDDAQAHANLGLALKNLSRPVDAIGHLQESLQLAPNNPRTYNNLGSIFVELGRIRESVPLFQQALNIQPEFPEVHFNLGCAFLHLRQFEQAAASLRTCLTLKPDFADGQTKLALALAELEGPGNEI